MTESLRLFLVDDDPDEALLMRLQLQRAGHHVTHCRSAADALIVLGHSQFHLVLVDQELPDMKGLDLLQALLREGITTPVLMVTAYGDEKLATQALLAGAIDYVKKEKDLAFLAELPKRVLESVTLHKLRTLTRLLSAALDSARDGIAITDLQGTIMHVNGALEKLSGYSKDELLGQNPRLFKSGVHAPELYAELWRTVLSRASWQGELTNRRKDGSSFDVSLTVSPIVDSQGQLTHFVGIYRDVSERKQLERQLLQAQKMQSVGTLAGGVAHEFNNLLAGIQGYAALGLREPNLPATLREFLNFIVGLSERAAGLTRQLLAFARKPALSRQPTVIDKLVRTTADLVARTLHQEVRLELETVSSDGEPLTVLADPNQLQQVIVNLALNARDSLKEPSPIAFRLTPVVVAGEKRAFPDKVPGGDYVVLEVIDEGCGMTPEVLSQALDPFFTTKGVGQGTGLGLPMVFGIVHGHQGYLTIDSSPGRGTCVGLYLPRLAVLPEGAEASGHGAEFESGQILEPESIPGRSILVVDDEQAVLDVVRRFLEIAGHKVLCAVNGREALALLEGSPPIDLIILDLIMPHDEEASTFERLSEKLPDVPVLLCTGFLQQDPAPHLLASGAVGLLRKPFRMNELWYAVARALAGKSP